MNPSLPRILVVDDEPDICWALANILQPAGYTVTTATSAAEALALLSGGSDLGEAPYAAAFVDAKLPDLNGLELADLIHQRSPHTAVVLVSGYFYREDSIIVDGLEKKLFVGFVAKPFSLHEVRLMASHAVEQAREENHATHSHSSGG
jgi:CheY-like chemotaxis protein